MTMIMLMHRVIHRLAIAVRVLIKQFTVLMCMLVNDATPRVAARDTVILANRSMGSRAAQSLCSTDLSWQQSIEIPIRARQA